MFVAHLVEMVRVVFSTTSLNTYTRLYTQATHTDSLLNNFFELMRLQNVCFHYNLKVDFFKITDTFSTSSNIIRRRVNIIRQTKTQLDYNLLYSHYYTKHTHTPLQYQVQWQVECLSGVHRHVYEIFDTTDLLFFSCRSQPDKEGSHVGLSLTIGDEDLKPFWDSGLLTIDTLEDKNALFRSTCTECVHIQDKMLVVRLLVLSLYIPILFNLIKSYSNQLNLYYFIKYNIFRIQPRMYDTYIVRF